MGCPANCREATNCSTVFHTGPDGSGSSKKRVSRAGKTSVILFSHDLLQGGHDMRREFLGYVETLHRGKLTEKFQPLAAFDFATTSWPEAAARCKIQQRHYVTRPVDLICTV